MLNMFQAPLCPASGAHDDSVGYHISHLVLKLLLVRSYMQAGWMNVRSYMQAGWKNVRTEGCNTSRVIAFGPDILPSCLHVTPNQQLENQTAYVITNAIVVSS